MAVASRHLQKKKPGAGKKVTAPTLRRLRRLLPPAREGAPRFRWNYRRVTRQPHGLTKKATAPHRVAETSISGAVHRKLMFQTQHLAAPGVAGLRSKPAKRRLPGRYPAIDASHVPAGDSVAYLRERDAEGASSPDAPSAEGVAHNERRRITALQSSIRKLRKPIGFPPAPFLCR